MAEVVELDPLARLAQLEAWATERDQYIMMLQTKLNEFDERLSHIEEDISGLVSATESTRANVSDLGARLNPGLPSEVGQLREQIRSMTTHFVPPMDSAICGFFPDVFTQMHGKEFTLLWRGSQDEFRIHPLDCDREQTLVLILDTSGNIFGGVQIGFEVAVPGMWVQERPPGSPLILRSERVVPSPSSFIFTLKNPHLFSPTIFPRRRTVKGRSPSKPPGKVACFGDDILLDPVCNRPESNTTAFFGTTYVNDDLAVDASVFFTGGHYFTVREIEIFKITGY
jgi:hypothetical protein